MTRKTRIFTATCITTLFLATPAMADCHGDWDANADTRYDQTEFLGGIGENEWFTNRDADRDGSLSETEFGAGLYDSYDTNKDGSLAANEWSEGFGETESYGAWDTDGNGSLSETEFGTGFGESKMYGEWDRDGNGLLSEDEFGGGVYTTYDADRSGYLDDDESGVACDDYGEEGFWDL